MNQVIYTEIMKWNKQDVIDGIKDDETRENMLRLMSPGDTIKTTVHPLHSVTNYLNIAVFDDKSIDIKFKAIAIDGSPTYETFEFAFYRQSTATTTRADIYSDVEYIKKIEVEIESKERGSDIPIFRAGFEAEEGKIMYNSNNIWSSGLSTNILPLPEFLQTVFGEQIPKYISSHDLLITEERHNYLQYNENTQRISKLTKINLFIKMIY